MAKSVNPYNQELIADYPDHTEPQVESILQECHTAYRDWSKTEVAARTQPLRKVGELLLQEIETHARLITLEMGKPIQEARKEIEKCASVCDYFAANGPKFLADEIIATEAKKSLVAYEPLGIIFGIMPWNFPYWQVFRFLTPTLTAGNGCLLKHAANVTGCALAIEQLFSRAGYPQNLMRTLVIDHKAASKVIEDPRVKAVTLTGSEKAGMEVASKSGQQLKKTVMELGGSDPFIVLEDADLSLSAKQAVTARLINSGQSCIASKRFILHKKIASPFLELLKNHLEKLKIGDPMQDATNIGPLARSDLRDELHSQVMDSIAKGAKLEMGGEIPDTDGNFYPVTVLSNVKPGMRVYEEETFGPVYALIEAASEKEQIAIANDSPYGLGASLWTKDIVRGEKLGRTIESGSVFVNSPTVSNIHLPFGGIKKSGYGRELSRYGIHEFVNIKTLFIR